MNRYIDADKLKGIKFNSISNDRYGAYRLGWNDAINAIVDNAPTVDVVEVVRCDQCRHFEAINNDDHGWCKLISDFSCEMSVRYDDDFCSYGERADT